VTARAALLRRSGNTRDGRRFLIRPTSSEDAPALVALRDAIAAEGDLIAATPGDRTVLEEQLALAGTISQGGLSLTLEVEDAVAGHIVARRLYQSLDEDIAEIAIAVSNTARGVGLGRALMEVAIDWGRAVRLSKLSLGVLPANTRAITLYRSLGFVDDPPHPQRVVLPVGVRDLLLMRLVL
jgi:acetyltransferase